MRRTGWQNSSDIGKRIDARELRLQNAQALASDDQLIAEFLERRGVTRCPPGGADRFVLQAMRWTRRIAHRR